jgi:hypothetical protein
MITMPRRSVTRFFIPMIDVLTLLFCMFLLMPIIRENELLSQEGPTPPTSPADIQRDIEAEKRELRALLKEQQGARVALEELQAKKRNFLQQHLVIRVLDISPRDGSLSYFDPRQPASAPLKIDSEDDARQLIARHKKEAADLDLFYVFQRPQDPAIKVPLYPTDRQTEQYRTWFRDVAYGGYLTQLKPAKGAPP